MTIIAVDDERLPLKSLEKIVLEKLPAACVKCFEIAADALKYAEKQQVDIAFLDINMPDINGLTLAKELKDIYGGTNIIFVTGYSDYMQSAFGLRASGYLLKPINAGMVAEELENLRHPLNTEMAGLVVQCFGNFEVFMNGKPISFSRSKSKELFAYLVDRKGAGVSKKELADILWEDGLYNRSRQIQLQTLIAEMQRALNTAGAGDAISKQHGIYYANVLKFTCDYYEYEKGDIKAVNSYHGEYMSNYSWAEFTLGSLHHKL